MEEGEREMRGGYKRWKKEWKKDRNKLGKIKYEMRLNREKKENHSRRGKTLVRSKKLNKKETNRQKNKERMK
jgi:hypothetical protein